MKKFLAVLLFTFSSLTMSAAFADAPKLGTEFDAVAQAISTENPAKIEVMEIFWYGCPHCYHMEEPLNTWVKKLPKEDRKSTRLNSVTS